MTRVPCGASSFPVRTVARAQMHRGPEGGHVGAHRAYTLADQSYEMMRVAKTKYEALPLDARTFDAKFVVADAEQLTPVCLELTPVCAFRCVAPHAVALRSPSITSVPHLRFVR